MFLPMWMRFQDNVSKNLILVKNNVILSSLKIYVKVKKRLDIVKGRVTIMNLNVRSIIVLWKKLKGRIDSHL